jgi:hypothetical protein
MVRKQNDKETEQLSFNHSPTTKELESFSQVKTLGEAVKTEIDRRERTGGQNLRKANAGTLPERKDK